MKEIDNYINSLYKNMNIDSKEVSELKNDMKFHLLQTVEELKNQGYTQKESIKIAIERFGQVNEIESELKNELFHMRTISQKGIRTLLYFFIISLLALIILLRNSFNDVTMLKGSILIFTIPIYGIIQCVLLEEKRNKGFETTVKRELFKFLFGAYIIFIISKTLFPIYTSPSNASSISPVINLIPFKTIIESIIRMSNNGFSATNIIFTWSSKLLLFIPLGFLLPVTFDKFKNIKNGVLFTISIYILISIIQVFQETSGFAFTVKIISIDYLLIYICGLLTGYYIYFKCNYKTLQN